MDLSNSSIQCTSTSEWYKLSTDLSRLFSDAYYERATVEPIGSTVVFSKLTGDELCKKINFYRNHFIYLRNQSTIKQEQQPPFKQKEIKSQKETSNHITGGVARRSCDEQHVCGILNCTMINTVDDWYQCQESGFIHYCSLDDCLYGSQDHPFYPYVCARTGRELGFFDYHQWQVEKEDTNDYENYKEMVEDAPVENKQHRRTVKLLPEEIKQIKLEKKEDPINLKYIHTSLNKDRLVPNYMKSNYVPLKRMRKRKDVVKRVSSVSLPSPPSLPPMKRLKTEPTISLQPTPTTHHNPYSYYNDHHAWLSIFQSSIKLYFSVCKRIISDEQVDILGQLCYHTFQLITSSPLFNKQPYSVWYHTLIILYSSADSLYSKFITPQPWLKSLLVEWHELKQISSIYSLNSNSSSTGSRTTNKKKLPIIFEYKQQVYNKSTKLFHLWINDNHAGRLKT